MQAVAVIALLMDSSQKTVSGDIEALVSRFCATQRALVHEAIARCAHRDGAGNRSGIDSLLKQLID